MGAELYKNVRLIAKYSVRREWKPPSLPNLEIFLANQSFTSICDRK
jgi:hypothetical protein